MNLVHDINLNVVLGYELGWRDYCDDNGIKDPYAPIMGYTSKTVYDIKERPPIEVLEEYDNRHGKYIAECIYKDFGREALMLTEWAQWVEDDWVSCFVRAGQCNMMCPYYNGGRCEWKGLE